MVHAGLDIMRDELRQMHSSQKACVVLNSSNEVTEQIGGLLELVDDIFTASDSAINILNDLLDYEHMDAGSELIHLHQTYRCF